MPRGGRTIHTTQSQHRPETGLRYACGIEVAGARPMNHSLISANGKTHAKITLLAVAVSLVFVAAISASGVTRTDGMASRTSGPVVKATTTTAIATSNGALVR